MNFFHYSTLLLLFLAAFISDRQVTGKCGSEGIADTPWAACLVAEEGGVCPHNFKKLDSDGTCGPRSRRTPAWKDRVCCLLGPAFDLKVANSPCLADSQPSDDVVEKKTHQHN
ncbi:hypothetical protein OS493_000736 [Desmophyllum pertusum]|uniref:Uncharacterized protein n=1 Tax=Desmophyllum pertusum TaxID=174260 RepID=A0A9X0ABD8_9CNID|nr:hypothetical protein OS493_000736 [Desmophyllum pertusum]